MDIRPATNKNLAYLKKVEAAKIQQSTEGASGSQRKSTRNIPSRSSRAKDKKGKGKAVENEDELEDELVFTPIDVTPMGMPIAHEKDIASLDADEVEMSQQALLDSLRTHREPPSWLPKQCLSMWPALHNVMVNTVSMERNDFHLLVLGRTEFNAEKKCIGEV